MTIVDSIKKIEQIEEGPGAGRFLLTLEQGATVETQGGSHANDWALNHVDKHPNDNRYTIKLNTVGRAVVIQTGDPSFTMETA